MKVSNKMKKEITKMIASCDENTRQIDIRIKQLTVGKFKMEGARDILESLIKEEEKKEKKDGV